MTLPNQEDASPRSGGRSETLGKMRTPADGRGEVLQPFVGQEAVPSFGLWIFLDPPPLGEVIDFEVRSCCSGPRVECPGVQIFNELRGRVKSSGKVR